MTTWTALFDLDGVLVDSQDAEVQALLDFAESVQAKVPANGLSELVAGRRMQESVDIIAQYTQTRLPHDAVGQVRKIADNYLQDRLCATPGVYRALRGITMRKYVVSNSPLNMIQDRLSRTGLAAFFRGPHFSAYELGVWKPDPGLYRKAVQLLALDPKTVVAIEDSRVGVRSAHGAGLRVYWYQPGQPAQSLCSSSIRVFGDMSVLPELIATDS